MRADCPDCGRDHGVIGTVDCGHSFCEDCQDDPDRADACGACEAGLPTLTAPRGAGSRSSNSC